MTKRLDNERLLILGDSHFPYHHKNTIEFLTKVSEFYNPDRVIHLGDILDIYSVSSYPSDMNHPDSWSDELKKGREMVKRLSELFPKMDILSSNHDDRAYRKSVVSGVPREFLVPYLDVIGAPQGWKIHDRLSITVDSTRDRWLFAHTINGGSLNAAKQLGLSVCLGHSHSLFGAHAFSNGGNRLLWGVDAGCLISDKGSPYKYNKGNIGRPIRGCCIIESGTPVMIPMS